MKYKVGDKIYKSCLCTGNNLVPVGTKGVITEIKENEKKYKVKYEGWPNSEAYEYNIKPIIIKNWKEELK